MPPLSHNNTLMTDPTKKAESLHKTLANPLSPKLNKMHKEFHKKMEAYMKNIKFPKYHKKQAFTNILNNTIQYYEIRNCMSEINKYKAYGPYISTTKCSKTGPTLDQLKNYSIIL